MSKNTVDAALELAADSSINIGFIPSRRQVDYAGGYVNNWTTKQFANYVSGKTIIQRDHGGPEQGYESDDGYTSFTADAYCFNMIHIDPWKAHQEYDAGLEWTIKYINYINSLNKNMLFEIGTEEAIRSFSTEELESFLTDLKGALYPSVFNKIKYAVVQSGVGLDLLNKTNTGNFSLDKLRDMCKVCKDFGVLSKEHNGDYLTGPEIRLRYENGLDAINIAPELGQIETRCYIEHLTPEELKTFYNICYNSGRWKKWVSLDDLKDDKDLISVCGHYMFADEKFLKIKPDIDQIVKQQIKERLKEILQ